MSSGPLGPCFPFSFFYQFKELLPLKKHNYIMPSHNAFFFDLEALIFFCCYVIKHLSPKHILISTQTEYVLHGNEPTTISLLRSQSDIDNTTLKALKDVFFGLLQLKILYSQMIGHVSIYLIEMHGILYILLTLDDIKMLVDGMDLKAP